MRNAVVAVIVAVGVVLATSTLPWTEAEASNRSNVERASFEKLSEGLIEQPQLAPHDNRARRINGVMRNQPHLRPVHPRQSLSVFPDKKSASHYLPDDWRASWECGVF